MKTNIRKYTRPLKNRFKYGDADYDPVEYLVFEDRQLVLLVVSKVACTSIKATIGKSYGIEYQEASGLDIHSDSAWQRFFGILPDRFKGFRTAAFVRDPFSRLVSCYKDRVVYQRGHQDFRNYYFHNYPYRIPENSDFSDFVEIICDIPDKNADRHFKSQSWSVSKLAKPLDFIGRFENIDEDWLAFATEFGFEKKLGRLNPSNRQNESLEKDFRKYFDKKSFALVRERYRKDIEQFSYQHIEKELEAFIESRS